MWLVDARTEMGCVVGWVDGRLGGGEKGDYLVRDVFADVVHTKTPQCMQFGGNVVYLNRVSAAKTNENMGCTTSKGRQAGRR